MQQQKNKFTVCYFFQIKANTPVLMCSVPGYDASGWVDDLATELGKQLTPIAIGKWFLSGVNFMQEKETRI